MNARERVLGLVVGLLLAAVVLYLINSWVSGQFRARRDAIAAVEGKIKQKEREVRQGIAAAKKVRLFEQRSLPPQPSVARSEYPTWLLQEAERVGLADPQVVNGPVVQSNKVRDFFVQQTFSLTGRAPLPKVVEMLGVIYSADYAHRIGKLSLRPVKDSKDLEITLAIEALSLRGAPLATKLHGRKSERLALPLEDFVRVIGERNLFGPPNVAPKFGGSSSAYATTGQRFETTLKASDPNPYDRVVYKLLEAGDKLARLDSASGRLSFTPSKAGEYAFVVEARDDGLPQGVSSVKFTVRASDPPPPKPPEPAPPPKLAFDLAKYTDLTAVIEVNGQPEVWLHVRPLGQMLKLHVGDKFDLGSIKNAVIEEIDSSGLVFVWEGKQRKLERGMFLEQAGVLGGVGGSGNLSGP
jgi:hypothetical protein